MSKPRPSNSAEGTKVLVSDPGNDPENPIPVVVVASLQKVTEVHQITEGPMSSGSLHYGNASEGATCDIRPPLLGSAFKVRKNAKGKFVRDVWVDTHDLINEPGGFILNMSRHGTSTQNELKIHLCLRQKRQCTTDRPAVVTEDCEIGVDHVAPGTLSLTDDYSREIFRQVRSHVEVQTLTAILEISDKEDPFEFKEYPSTAPTTDFLCRFIQVCPSLITKCTLEMPGLSAVYLPEWKFLLEQQTCLQLLICNFGVVLWNFYEKTILHNLKTLERVILRRLQTYDSGKAIYVPLKWSIFEKCEKLAHLKVTCGFRNMLTSILEPAPPNYVFLHEGLDSLPKHDAFTELHLGKIWIDPCVLRDFSKVRPKLTVCQNCFDMEYFDADVPLGMRCSDQGIASDLRLVTVSRIDIQATFPPGVGIDDVLQQGDGDQEQQQKRKHRHHHHHLSREERTQRKFIKIVIILFVVILLALAGLFIIIFWKYWRAEAEPSPSPNNSSVAPTHPRR